MFAKIPMVSMISILFLVVLIVLFLVMAQSYFNSSLINLLVENAEDLGLEYEVIIHNNFTNSFDFQILDGTNE